jgi:hypothetical protein
MHSLGRRDERGRHALMDQNSSKACMTITKKACEDNKMCGPIALTLSRLVPYSKVRFGSSVRYARSQCSFLLQCNEAHNDAHREAPISRSRCCSPSCL